VISDLRLISAHSVKKKLLKLVHRAPSYDAERIAPTENLGGRSSASAYNSKTVHARTLVLYYKVVEKLSG